MSHSTGSPMLLRLLLLALAAPAAAQGLGPPPEPPENPTTPAKVLLGQALFWDEQLSSIDTMACATCHLPEAAGADPRTLADLEGTTYIGWDRTFGTADDTHSSPGISSHRSNHTYIYRKQTGMGPQLTIRNTPLVFDSAYAPELLLDGRAPETFTDPMTGAVVSTSHAALEAQALLPFVDEKEMSWFGRPFQMVLDDVEASEPLALAGNVPAALEAWIAGRGYAELYEEAFGSPGVTTVRTAQALASFQRSLVTHGHLPFDDFLNGDAGALTPLERQGYYLFVGAAGCAECHPGAILTDHVYRNIGLDDVYDDEGRRRVTLLPEDQGRFRTPTLRNVALTAPYFHDGSATTLGEAVEFFDVGGHYQVPNIDPLMQPLGLTDDEKKALVAFLGRPLTDPRARTLSGPYERLELYAESSRLPEVFGEATTTSLGEDPEIVLLEPSRLGRTITVAIQDAVPGAPVGLLLSPMLEPAGVDVQGALLYPVIGPGAALVRATLASGGLGAGSQSVRVSLPSSHALVGTYLYAQWIVFDPTPTRRLAATPAVRMLLFD
ncbi:MAG: cytochrome c peroxidase [Planctomycetota bacterium]